MATTAPLVVKFGAKTLTCPAGGVTYVKRALALLSGLRVNEMRLVIKGKVVKDDDENILSGKAMLMRGAPAPPTTTRTQPTIRFSEIVTSRDANPIEVKSLALSHQELVELACKTLCLPPCDEQTEVRLFMPQVNALMRIDLHLNDYPQLLAINGGSETIHLIAVPCPIGLQRMRPAEVEAEMHAQMRAADSSDTSKAARGGADDSDSDDDEYEDEADELPAAARLGSGPGGEIITSSGIPKHMLAALLASADPAELQEYLGDVAPPPPPSGHDLPNHIMLPPSLAEAMDLQVSATPRAVADSQSASSPTSPTYLLGSSSSSSSSSSSASRPPPPMHPASLVPAKLRSGLMPDPADDDHERYELRVDVLDECCFMATPTAEQWEMMAQEEEALLEEKCIELVRTLAPPPHVLTTSSSANAVAATMPKSAGRGRQIRLSSRPGTPRTPQRPPLGKKMERSASFADLEGSLASSSSHSNTASYLACAPCIENEPPVGGSGGGGADAEQRPCQLPSSPVTPLELKRGAKISKGFSCFECDRRLPLTACASACKCGEVYCAEHMHSHSCSHNYRRQAQSKLREDNPKLESSRLERM